MSAPGIRLVAFGKMRPAGFARNDAAFCPHAGGRPSKIQESGQGLGVDGCARTGEELGVIDHGGRFIHH